MKNYTRERNAKDAFSLFENENHDFMMEWNRKYEKIKEELKLKITKSIASNDKDVEKAFNDIDSHVAQLHIKFEDWLFEDKSYRKK